MTMAGLVGLGREPLVGRSTLCRSRTRAETTKNTKETEGLSKLWLVCWEWEWALSVVCVCLSVCLSAVTYVGWSTSTVATRKYQSPESQLLFSTPLQSPSFHIISFYFIFLFYFYFIPR